jgi:hypothetical protein
MFLISLAFIQIREIMATGFKFPVLFYTSASCCIESSLFVVPTSIYNATIFSVSAHKISMGWRKNKEAILLSLHYLSNVCVPAYCVYHSRFHYQ